MRDSRKNKHWSKVLIAISIFVIIVWVVSSVYLVKEYPAMRDIFFMLAIKALD